MERGTLLVAFAVLMAGCAQPTQDSVTGEAPATTSPPPASTVDRTPTTPGQTTTPATTTPPSRPAASPGQPVLKVERHRMFADGERHYVVGEVSNQGGAPAVFPKLTLTAYDAAGAVLATESTFLHADPIPPGLTVPFKLELSPAQPPTDYRLTVEGQPSTAKMVPTSSLVIVPQTNSTDALGDVHAYGEVQNMGDKTAYAVHLVGAFLDGNGEILDVCEDTIEAILPAERFPFECQSIFRAVQPASMRFVAAARAEAGSFLPTVRLDVGEVVTYEGSFGVVVDGTVKNPGGRPVTLPKVVIALYDEQDRVVGTDFTFAFRDPLPGGATTHFHNAFLTTQAAAARVKAFASAAETTTTKPPPQATVQGLSNQTDAFGGKRLLGEVVNRGTSPLSLVEVGVAWLDADGRLLAANHALVSGTIPPGGTAPFEVSYPRDVTAASMTIELG